MSTTIAAIATPLAPGAIAIVRISGPGSLEIANAVYQGPSPLPSERPERSFVRCFIKSVKDGEIIDEAIMLIFRAPHSYTKQDVVEIQCHGGIIQARWVLKAVLEAGAEEAEPGEFTYRAFMNGRIDLVQAEAVLDLIMSRSMESSSLALRVLSGDLSHGISRSYELSSEVLSIIEGYINLPDDETSGPPLEKAINLLSTMKSILMNLLNTSARGALLREGARVVICGRPNVGKSSVFNQLVGHERAIVTEIPGTTRDLLEETIILDGIPIVLVDTAGLGITSTSVDTIAQTKASQQIQQANLIVYVIDISEGITPDDTRIIQEYRSRCVLVKNKIDLAPYYKKDSENEKSVMVCAIKGTGIPELREMISREIANLMVPSRLALSDRNVRLLSDALKHCETAHHYLTDGETELIKASMETKECMQCLSSIIGKEISQDIMDSIFSKFCVGK